MSTIKTKTVKKLLVVLAHPDDETFGMGGTLALYAQRGVNVQLICATRGEVGEVDPQFRENLHSAACLRTQELRCAAEVLGLAEIHFLKYRDSGMPGSPENHHPKALAAQPVEQVAREVAHFIRQIRPEVVLTFDPIGGYRHPDHIAVHKATVLGFDLAGDPDFVDQEGLTPFRPVKLLYHTINKTFLKMSVWVMRLIGQDPRRFGRNKDIDLVSLTEIDFPTHVKINYWEVKDLKAKAAACHASQGGLNLNLGLRGLISRLFSGHNETFMQAIPEPEEHGKISRDLFIE